MKQLLISLISFLSILVISGCELSDSQAITVIFPAPPAKPGSLWPCKGFVLKYPGPSGEFISVNIPGGQTHVNIRLQKQRNIAVTAYPVFESSSFGFRPAGAILPLSFVRDKLLVLSWEMGMLAEILQQLSLNNPYFDSLNIQKLTKMIKSTAWENPWQIDRKKLLDALLGGRFTSGFVRLYEPVTLAVPFTSGKWIFSDPFLPPLRVNHTTPGNEVEKDVMLYPGIFMAICDDDNVSKLIIHITETDWTWTKLPGNVTESGKW